MRRVFLCLLLCLCASWAVAHGRLQGVPEALVSRYQAAEAAKQFTCFDGSKAIPFSSVNDDVCDCADGSDEPGTSACSTLVHGVVAQLPEGWAFQCTNEGFFEQQFPHSRVNDGICDCCDGSDELTSGVSCPNRCAEVVGELQRRREEERKRMQIAAANKAAMTAEIMKHRAELAKALPGQQAEHEKILKELPSLEEKHNALQKTLEAAREELRVKYEEWESTKEEREAAEDASSCIKWRQTGRCKGDGPREADKDKDCLDVVAGKDSGYCECAVEDMDEGHGVENDDKSADEEEKTRKYEFACGHPELTCLHVCDNDGEAAVGAARAAPQDPASYTSPEAKAAEEAVTSRRNRLAELEKNIAEATKVLNSTTPSTEELLRTLEGKSFAMEYKEYTYDVTMFKEVRQRNKGMSSGGQLLGKWKSFAENTYAMWSKDPYDLTQMLYDQGDRCWNGVIRKTDIHLVCGPENKLTHIEEPSMCVYRMVLETPAMCSD